MNIISELSYCLLLSGLLLLARNSTSSTDAFSTVAIVEVCDNGTDDDGDGLIDAFDPDCQCNGRLSPNLVPNGQFNETTGCCANLGELNCLSDWIVLGPSPDYISDNCTESDLRPDVRFLTNALNQGSVNDGYIFSVIQSVEGRQFTESLGVCLEQPMEAGKTYEVSFQLANLRDDAPDLLFSLVGIDLCDRLTAYDTRGNNSFCDRQLPANILGSVNARDLATGWNNLSFEVSPEENIEAIFYAVECGFVSNGSDAVLYMVLDEVSIREQSAPPMIPEITLLGRPCEEAISLSIPWQVGASYQWYQDSIPIDGATDTLLRINEDLSPNSGSYQVLIRDLEGNCDLTEPYELIPPALFTQVFAGICEGDRYGFSEDWINSTGVYRDTLNSVWGCDSIIELQLDVWSSSVLIRSASICAGENFAFGGQMLSETGQYQDSLLNVLGCDSVIILELLVAEEVRSSFADSVCSGEVYFFAGELLTEEGTYRDTLQTTEGCDSIISLELTLLSHAFGDTLFVEQPQGTTYDFHGRNYADAGVYEAVLSATNGCDSTIYLALSFYDPCSIPLVVNAVGVAATCAEAANGQIEVFVDGAFPPYRYSLDNQSAQLFPIFEDLRSGIYSIEVEDAFGCSQSISIGVAVMDDGLKVDLGPDTSVYFGEQIDLEPIHLDFEPTELIWSREEVIACRDCPILTVSPTQGARYQLEVIDEFGCSAFDEIWVAVIPPPKFYLPNAFSPNDDGINDVFRVEGKREALGLVKEMTIYSRWGDLLFQVEGQDELLSWDGLVKGRKAEAGVYVYTIQWRNFRGEMELIRGDVLLIR